MLREASRWPASTPSKPISLARAITVERAALSSAQVNTVGFSPLAGSRINAEEMDVNAVTTRPFGTRCASCSAALDDVAAALKGYAGIIVSAMVPGAAS